MDERRRLPGMVSSLWCRKCKSQFGVAGRHRVHIETPAIELVVCPDCRDMRRMVLPPAVGAPFRVIGPGGRTRRS
jgi:hypothetical protein